MSYIPRTERTRDTGTSSGYVPRSERNKTDSSSSSSTTDSGYVPRSQRPKEDSSSRTSRLKSELDNTPERPAERYVPRSERNKDTSSSSSSASSSYTPTSTTTSRDTSSYTSSRTSTRDDKKDYYKPSFTPTYTAEASRDKRDYASVKPYEGRSGTSSAASSASASRGGVEKPKKQVEHERHLEKIKKDFEGDYKKKAVIQLERKQRDWERLWKEEEKRDRDNERKNEQWKKKVERDEEEHANNFEQLKATTAEKEQQRMTREKDSEDRFTERVTKTIQNNAQKKQQKHEQWESKMQKRLARNKILDDKRRKRLNDRANAKAEQMQAERIDAAARKTRRREHFLLSYQSSWSEHTLEEAADNSSASAFVAPELQAATVGAFVLGDTRHLNNEGLDTTTAVTVTHKTEAQRKADVSHLVEVAKELEEKARLALEAELMDGTDDLLAALEEEPVKPAAKPSEPAKKAGLDESEKEELLLDLEDELEGLLRDLSKAKQKVGDAEDLLADIDKGDEEMLEQAETELLDAEEELVNVEEKIKKCKAKIKEIESS